MTTHRNNESEPPTLITDEIPRSRDPATAAVELLVELLEARSRP